MSPVSVIVSMFNDMKGWLIAIFVSVTVAVVVYHALEYQKSTEEDERVQAMKSMKRKLYMTGGVFVLVWLVPYIYSKFSVLQ